jgi:hypothetical protein
MFLVERGWMISVVGFCFYSLSDEGGLLEPLVVVMDVVMLELRPPPVEIAPEVS